MYSIDMTLRDQTFFQAMQAHAEAQHADLQAYARQVADLAQRGPALLQEALAACAPEPARCAVCGGTLRSSAALERLQATLLQQMRYEGPTLNVMVQERSPLAQAEQYTSRVPHAGECQTCGGFLTSAPAPDLGPRWTPAATPARSTALAAVVFAEFPQVEEVVYEVTSNQAGWLFRVGRDTWYYYAAPRARVVERLGLSARQPGRGRRPR